MTPPRRGPRWGAGFAVLVAAVFFVAACAGATSPVPTVPGPTAGTPEPTGAPPSQDPGRPGGGATPPPQTDTDWGRIWDDLPADFPLPIGARPAQTGEGPASALLDVPGDVTSTMAFLQSTLEAAGFRTEALSGPLEDGSRILDSFADGGCRVRASVAPLGGSTILTVLYGAACPFP